MRDPYQILGVERSASAAEIKSAYRKLAKKLHPDVNQGKKDIEQKFKEVTAAYDLLSDSEKRARFDRGEIDAQGNERGFGGGGGSYGGGNPFGGGGNWRNRARSTSGAGGRADPFGGFEGVDDIFAEFMRGQHGSRANPGPQKGADVTYVLTVPLTEACLGSKRRVTLASGKTIDVTLPAGTHEGDKLRLRSQGEAGTSGAGPGDALIEIHVEPHAFFTRKDKDIYLDVPISLPEAVLGASVKVPTLDGQVSVKVAKGTNSGTTLRLKGKGVPSPKGDAGDMFVKLTIMLPDPPQEDLAETLEKWSKKNPYDPRKKLGWE